MNVQKICLSTLGSLSSGEAVWREVIAIQILTPNLAQKAG
jgi:hypothetical protein